MPQHEHIGLLIAATRRRIKQLVVGLAEPFGLSPQQFWVLVAVSEREGSALVDVARRHRMDQPTASRVVAALMKRRLVRVAVDPEDRRRSRLLLTPSGKALALQLRPLADEVREAIAGSLSAAERERLAVSLGKIITAVEHFSEVRNGVADPPVGGRGSR